MIPISELGVGYITITAHTGGMQRDIQKAFSGLDSSASKAGESLGSRLSSGISKTLKVGAAATGAAVAGTLGASIAKGFGRLQAFDQAEAKFRGLGKSAEEITTIMDGVNDAVTGTVFGLDEAAGSAAKLSGVGVEAGEEMNRMMTLTADIAAQAGRGMGEMDSVMAKILGSGKLTGETLAQLDDAATGASGAVADHLNVSIEEMRDMVSKGEVDVETFATAMEEHLGGAAQAGGETFSGAMSMVGSALGRLGATLIGPLFEAAPKVFGSLTDAVNNLHERVTPLAESFGEWLAPRVADFAENLGPRLESAIEGIATVIGNVVGFVRDNSDWLGPLVAGVGGAAGAFAAWTGAIKAWQTATKIATGVQMAFNAVMSANPIMLIVMAIAALVAGLVYFFTQTEMGKELWASFTEFLGNAWDWVVEKFSSGVEWVQEKWTQFSTAIVEFWESYIRPVFDAISQVVQTVLGVVFAAVVGAALAAWNVLSSAIQFGWENIIKPAWNNLQAVLQFLWSSVVQPIFTFIGDAWNRLAGLIQWAWQNIILVAWNNLQNVLRFLWGSVVQPIFNFIQAAWQTLANAIMAAWNGIIKPAWDALSGALQGLWNNVISPVLQWAGDKWQWFSDKIGEVIAWVRDVAFARFRDALQSLRDFFGSIVDGIRDVWNRLRGHLAKPINFMINTVYNGGILEAWETIRKFLPGLKEASPLSTIPEHATGGRISGPGTGTSDDVLMWGSNGEHMLTASDVVKFGGHAHVYRMRDAVQKGKPFISDGKGGILTMPKTRTDHVGDLAGAAPDLFPRYRDGGEIRPLWEAQLQAAHRFAHSQHGKPYQWAGPTGPGSSFDCSGFMGSIAAVIQGTNPWQRYWATMSFPSPGAQGFVPGLGPGFSIGIFNGGPYGGHTAGTLGPAGPYGSVNVESGGAPSMVKYGPGAVGADHSQFTMRYHLPIGADGAFVSGGGGGVSPETMRDTIVKKLGGAIDTIMDPIVSLLPEKPPEWQGIPRGVYESGKDGLVNFVGDAVGGLSDRLGSVFAAVSGMGDLVRDSATGAWNWLEANLFDTGGVWRSGTLGINLSGKNEYVFTNEAMRAFQQATEDLSEAAEKIADASSYEGAAARSLAREIGDVLNEVGFGSVGRLTSGLLDAEAELLKSREDHAARLAGIAEKEAELEAARAALSDAQSAEYESDEARREAVAKATDDVVKAEDDLTAARKDSAKNLDMTIHSVFPQLHAGLTQTAVAVGAAHPALGGLASQIGGLAALAGPGGISVGVAIQGVKTAITVFKLVADFISGIVGNFTRARAEVTRAVADMAGAIRDMASAVDDVRENITGLVHEQALAAIELAAAERELRIARWDGIISVLDGERSVAEAQAAFDAQRRVDMALAVADYNDLSLAHDRYRWGLINGLNESMDELAAWSDESHALYAELLAAQTGVQILELQAQRAVLEATYKSTLAALDLADVTASLGVAAQHLAIMTGQSFGMTTEEAMFAQREAELLARQAEIEGQKGQNWWRLFSWHASGANYSADRELEKINQELAALRSMEGYTPMGDAAQREIDDALSRARWMGFMGGGDHVADMIRSTALGDPARALDQMAFEQSIVDLRASQDALRRSIERNAAELENRSQVDPLDTQIGALEYELASHETWAEYWRADSDGLRSSLAKLAGYQADAAEAAQTPAQVNLYGSTANMDDVQAMLEELGYRVNRLEAPPASGRDVVDSRR